MQNSPKNNLIFRTSECVSLSRILTVYLTLKPLYLFSSGLPQISDMFLLVATAYLLFSMRGKLHIQKSVLNWVTIFLFTLAFQFVIQLVWWLITGEKSMVLTLSYYVFNFIAALLCFFIGSRIGPERLKRAICNGCFWSILVTAVSLLVGRNYESRMMGFFNNPNQLGYYALLITTIIAFFPNELPKWKNAVIIVVSVAANVLSLSKASILGLAGLTVCYTVWGSREKSLRQIVTQTLVLLVFFATFYWILFSDSAIVEGSSTLSALRHRINKMSTEKDSSLGSGRGYDRVKELGIHFLWGMGEGAYDRFQSLNGKEVHATLVNMVVSYGVVGAAAYLWLMGRTVLRRGVWVRNMACLSGLVLYSFTHNGIRNTLFWILLAAVMQCNSHEAGADRMILEGPSYESENTD